MKYTRASRILLTVVLAAILLTLNAVPGHTQGSTTEILWDKWGVPHIFAPDNAGLFYGIGWAQAQNHGNLILKLYGEARGRAAEYWGDEFLEGDRLVRTLDIPAQAVATYERFPAEFKTYLVAFTAGINDYAAAHPDRIEKKWQAVLPLKPTDILAHGTRTLRYTFVARAGISVAKGWQQETPPGSNGWAIGPTKSASGKAMLLANPHQPWSDLGLWFEAHLVSPDVDLYGAALVGNAVLGVGFNPYLGWTHTVNTHDGWDLYELSLTPNGYLFDGQEKPFETHTETLRVLQTDGTLKDEPLTVRKSVHGPVIAQRGEKSALALRVVADYAAEATLEWWEMGKARNLKEFEAALRPLRIPMFNVIYADRDGNIMYLFNELVPVRSEGDWAFWNNLSLVDPTQAAIIPGSTSRYLWTTYHPYEDLPKVVNPPSGWVQNANEPPWSATFPRVLDPAKYPPYMAPPPYAWPRPQNSIRMLTEHKTISFEEMIALKQSTFAELSNQVLDDLIAAARASSLPNAKKAAEVLAKWDRHTGVDSVGAALFTAWGLAYVQPTGTKAFAKKWDINDPLNTPRGLSDPAAAVAALDKVAGQLEALRLVGGGMDVKYGDAFRFRVGKYDLPASGGFDVMGTFRTFSFAQDKDLRFKAVHGDSFIAAVEFSQPIRAKVLLAFGNSTQPDSPHLGDQLPLLAQKQLRDPWLTRAQIEANLEDRVAFPMQTIHQSIEKVNSSKH